MYMRVVVVKVKGNFTDALMKGFSSLCSSPGDCLKKYFKGKFASLKVNTLSGKMVSTTPELSYSMGQIVLNHLGDEVIIWDRSEREMKHAGYRIKRRGTMKVIATDSPRVGYSQNLIVKGNIGSLFSRIQMAADVSVSIAVLKDHDIAGVTLAMKNYYGAIHNPNKYHDNGCNPFIPELFSCEPIVSRHILSIIDVTKAQFHRGPAYHSRWYTRPGYIIMGQDPVAVDHFGWKFIEKLRQKAGLPPLKEENREPVWLYTAEKMGLGSTKYEVIEL